VILEVLFEDERHQVPVTAADIAAGAALFARMDQDMDPGWRMGPEFVKPMLAEHRAQIAANRLMVALEQGNRAMSTAMAAYILNKLPDVTRVRVDSSGEPLETEFERD
jgi:hypothetical protein